MLGSVLGGLWHTIHVQLPGMHCKLVSSLPFPYSLGPKSRGHSLRPHVSVSCMLLLALDTPWTLSNACQILIWHWALLFVAVGHMQYEQFIKHIGY